MGLILMGRRLLRGIAVVHVDGRDAALHEIMTVGWLVASGRDHQSINHRRACVVNHTFPHAPSSSFPIFPTRSRVMANPPTLPISDHSGVSQSQQTVSAPAFRTFLSRLSASIRQSLSQRRPWLELVDRSAISRPDSLTDAYSRIRRNLPYFKVNYVTIVSLVLALSLLSHPLSLLVLLCLFGAWIFLYLFRQSDQPLVVLGRTFSDRETLAVLVVLTIVVVFLTSVGSLLTSALIIGFGIVCLHGAFRVPEDLFLDEQEPANTGLLSFLSGAATSAAVAAASAPVSARV